ncbi:glycosyltransferase [Paraburkholderia terricola]|uniref:Glycosyltransferase involved in cell wall biosynthesis/polysaccharide pyruvyl transferase WcaK-like protein n=1 Tax=Paraburkholderia terricola TaxID=169427 RepID=A0ABU1LTS5_9BURK|nr:glycosyltransferase [Paraburkholderia terricola]MDR6410124.1 glycosyltransferase involved in cell wall biosynthesis/polysaccharide pyruvyl transferase WcaK-like protein [Paraburkholderia terricola]MDR6481284.1 glycosyltransferase involved in cell wall biosynthesis/polysaccharide pyruvyl transferase WcaK-like protein [Paraburkholderia terricola]
MKTPDVYLLHAYSSHNSGDGLLVKLSLRAIREAGFSQRITVVCLDPASFVGYLDDPQIELISLWQFVAGTLRHAWLRRAPVFFGVGGGYLRAGTWKEGCKTLVAHGLQIVCASLRGSRSRIYLPQSVGPFSTAPGRVLKWLVRRHVDTMFLRDDKSVHELNHRHAVRIGDLVVLEISKRPHAPRFTDNESSVRGAPRKVYFVFRDLNDKPYADAYIAKLRRLVELTPDASFAVQSAGRGNSDDLFYQRVFGVGSAPALRDVIRSEDAIVVSVRLHGSLESVLGGLPSIHIAYERKGQAAYGDLGLSEYAFHAESFDPEAVAASIEKLRRDPAPFWQKLASVSVNRHAELVGLVRAETGSSITLLIDGNFSKLGDQIFSPHMGHRKFAARFTESFARVRIAARSFPAQNAHGELVTGADTEFIDLGASRGVKALIRHLPRLVWRIWRVIHDADLLLLRFPGNLTLIGMLLCRATGKPFSAEIVADPADYFSDAASRHPLRHIARRVHCWATRHAAKHGRTVRYVTAGALQEAYPPRVLARSFGFSDVYLPDELFDRRDEARGKHDADSGAFRIVNVAMMHNESKGHGILLRAVAALRARQLDVELTLIGDGILRAELERLAGRLGLGDSVRFVGALDGDEVLRTVSQHALFVLPSLQEGMPRALLEAMALGVPVIATHVGGVAEVLEPASLVPPADIDALSDKIAHIISDARWREQQTQSQRETVRRFRYSNVQAQYRHYCEALKAYG